MKTEDGNDAATTTDEVNHEDARARIVVKHPDTGTGKTAYTIVGFKIGTTSTY